MVCSSSGWRVRWGLRCARVRAGPRAGAPLCRRRRCRLCLRSAWRVPRTKRVGRRSALPGWDGRLHLGAGGGGERRSGKEALVHTPHARYRVFVAHVAGWPVWPRRRGRRPFRCRADSWGDPSPTARYGSLLSRTCQTWPRAPRSWKRSRGDVAERVLSPGRRRPLVAAAELSPCW